MHQIVSATVDFVAPLVGAGDRRRRAIHVRGRCLHRQCCDTDHCRRIARKLRADRGGDRDLSHCLCHAGDYRRPARRYLRHQECISGRRARLHADVAVVRAGANRTRIDPRAAGAGRDRGADGAAGARHPSSVVFRCLARPRLWHLRHGAWPCGRGRLFARRRAGDVGSRRAGLARGVFRQPAVRPDHHGRGLADHAVGAAACRHPARCSRRDRAVHGTVVSDRPAAVRSRSALGAVDLAGDGGRRRDRCRLPAARARRRKPWRHAADRSCAAVGRGIHARSVRDLPVLFRQPVVLSGDDHVHAARRCIFRRCRPAWSSCR